MLALCRIVLSTEPLEENKGDIMLPCQVVDFAAGALASMGGTYTGEIEFSGGSARALRRLSRDTSQVEPLSPTACALNHPVYPPCVGILPHGAALQESAAVREGPDALKTVGD